MSVLALLSFLLFAGVITLQVLEWQYFAAAPSVWPPAP
jgi:hypothetical protein